MSSRHLRKLQSAFAAAVYEGRVPAALAELIVGDGLAPAARLGLYRNNTVLNLGDALAAAYPVLQRLLGADCFRALARAYIGAHPSRSGDLHDYGDALADFLAGLPELAALPYLADVARLEWRVHRAYFAAEAAPCDLAALLA
ncbi:MAG TPA: DNA-binding domain-containing protein, partial [Candidatus Competibacteraceae bacterium]|nr:DNA-binding domain-containing protein [Candidatus Competibacteraceae bacterium]